MTSRKQASSLTAHIPPSREIGSRIGFNLAPDTYDKFVALAEHFDVSNKDIFTALVAQAHQTYIGDKK